MASRRRPDPKSAFWKPAAAASESSSLRGILNSSRKSGQLNLSNRALGEVPASVWMINVEEPDPEKARNISLDNHGDKWWDQIDLTKLILASNCLKELSEDIELLPALTVLDIHDNNLTCLPQAVGELSNLLKLNISHNKLSSVPPSIGKLRRLQTLQLHHNKITEVEGFIGNLYDLEELDLSHNEILSLPPSIGHLTHVRSLDLSHNRLAELPVQLSGMNVLRELDCTHNQLIYIPAEIGNLAKLELVYLNHNRLPALPPLKNCEALKELHLGNNGIVEITASQLEQILQVVALDLRDNKIEVLPEEIAMLQALERLDVTNNNITNLPNSLGTMTNLKSIRLDGNPMKSIRRDIVMRGSHALKKYLVSRVQEPDLIAAAAVTQKGAGSSGVIGQQSDVDSYEVRQTKTLEYIGKKVCDIPLELWEAADDTMLEKINFSKNMLDKIPERLLEYSGCLTQLELGFNKIQHLTPDIGNFHKMVFLDLRNNQLSDLPREMTEMLALREITISFNRFTDFPSVLYSIKSLEVILASDNKISTVDASGVLALSRLATLDLQNNNMTTVPPELGRCTQLRSLQLEGNPMRQPRPAILAKGTVALLEYLRDRIPV